MLWSSVGLPKMNLHGCPDATHVAIALPIPKLASTATVNLSIKGTLNQGHLSNEDTACCPNHIELCTDLPLN